MINRVKGWVLAATVLLCAQAGAASLSDIQVSNGDSQARITFSFMGDPEYAFSQIDSRSVARRSNKPLTYEEIDEMAQKQTGIPIVPETVIPVVVILLIPTIALFIIFRVHRRRKRREDFSDGIPRS